MTTDSQPVRNVEPPPPYFQTSPTGPLVKKSSKKNTNSPFQDTNTLKKERFTDKPFQNSPILPLSHMVQL